MVGRRAFLTAGPIGALFAVLAPQKSAFAGSMREEARGVYAEFINDDPERAAMLLSWLRR